MPFNLDSFCDSYIWRHIISNPRLWMCRHAYTHTDTYSSDLLVRSRCWENGWRCTSWPWLCVHVYIAVHSLPVMMQTSTCIGRAFKSFRDSLVYLCVCVQCRKSAVLQAMCLLVRLSARQRLDLTWSVQATLLLLSSASVTLVENGSFYFEKQP